MSCAPIALAGGLLTPCKNGEIFLLDMQSTESLAEPFEPDFQGDWKWRRPAAVGRQRSRRLRRQQAGLSLRDRSRRRRQARRGRRRRQDAAGPADRRAAWRQSRRRFTCDNAGVLHALQLPSLTEGDAYQLGGACVWGPCRAGQVRSLGHGQRQVALLRRPAATALGNRACLWSAGGSALGRRRTTPPRLRRRRRLPPGRRHGKELGKAEVGSPLGCGPVEIAGRVFVAARDGCICEVQAL